jgi:acetyl-CoA C-acetyltransferase
MGREVVIVSGARTPVGNFQGGLAPLTAPKLGAIAIKAALERAGVPPTEVDEVFMGCVLQGGVGQAPARQAAIFGGLPNAVPCTTVNKVCGSGLKAVISGAQAIALGDAEVVVVGGMESMSNSPYYDYATRAGARMGNVELVDGMIRDGLWDVYDQVHMGVCAERTAAAQKISRGAQDEYARMSTERAQKAQQDGLFKNEIVPVEVPQRKGDPVTVSEDEGPKSARIDKLPTLKPAFQKDGTVTAGNASSINDGAAALVLMSAERAAAQKKTVLGTIGGYAQAARKPDEFTIAPADAMRKLFAHTKLTQNDIDLFEINEAFAVVSIANNQILGLDAARVNVRGGAIVLGHPIGASGARLLVTLVHAMKDLNKRRGVASLCIGGGEGIALLVERTP